MSYMCDICGEEKEEWELFFYDNFIKCKKKCVKGGNEE